MMRSSLRHWLSLRVRIICVLTFIIGSLMPPYIPKDALAQSDNVIPADATSQYLFVEDGFLMKTSSLTQEGSRRAYAQGLVYTVQNGDSVDKVAAKYHLKADTIRWANKLSPDAKLKPGQQLVILPVDGVLHTVTRGETLSRIAKLYSVSASAIAQQNNIQGGFILAGQQLIIPGGKPIVVPTPVQIASNTTPSKTISEQSPSPSPAVNPKVHLKPSTTRNPYNGRVPPASPGYDQHLQAPPTHGILQMPCEDCYYTQYYHPGHYAVDLQEKGGGPVFAAADGVVIRAQHGWNGGYGNVIEINHGNGLVTLYAHNKVLYVKKGDHVKRGQEISWMGNTGHVTGPTGIHVHFEVRVNGVKKNPVLYLQ